MQGMLPADSGFPAEGCGLFMGLVEALQSFYKTNAAFMEAVPPGVVQELRGSTT